MKLLAGLHSLLALLVINVLANTEKIIFVAPSPPKTFSLQDQLDQLELRTLTADNNSLRESLSVAFPTSGALYAEDHWYLLRFLDPGQRYEVRICWAATQPTEFRLDVFDFDEIFRTPELLSSFSSSGRDERASSKQPTREVKSESVLTLRVQAAASFFTTNRTLMQHPPPVHVDLILDPYLVNIFPRTLLPTAGYICGLVIFSWLLSGTIWSYFRSVADTVKAHKE